MKSSLAQTLEDIVLGQESRDLIYPARRTKRSVLDEEGNKIGADSLLVIKPYDDQFQTQRTSTLLVNPELRKQYETLHEKIETSKGSILSDLKNQARTKRDVEVELKSVFGEEGETFFGTLRRVISKMGVKTPNTQYSDVEYDKVFDEAVLSLLESKDFKIAIKGYIEELNKLLAKSKYFGSKQFNYWDGTEVSKDLGSHGFFKKGHQVLLNGEEPTQIDSPEELVALIAAEKEQISQDPEIRKKFLEIEKELKRNVTNRNFEAYLMEHEELLPLFADIPEGKRDVWKSYLWSHFKSIVRLIEKFDEAEKRRKEIEAQARRERTQWETVIELFNERFIVPFRLQATNKVSVVLGAEEAPALEFIFDDGTEQALVDQQSLVRVLSQGEKKALYILNIMFEVQARSKLRTPTLVVFDDIADSFDYKNKYAIVQYLRDIHENQNFKLLILTHNFDFFRTLAMRFVGGKQCLMAKRTRDGLTLVPAEGIQNVFVKTWRPKFFTKRLMRIACIPFMRNLVEYVKDSKDPSFKKLTSLLHWKPDTLKITQGELDGIFTAIFGAKGSYSDQAEPVVNCIAEEANLCLVASEGINFENKIVLAIGTRLVAERFMIKRINNSEFVEGIKSNQTSILVTEFQRLFGAEVETLKILRKVELMTPENIHLNSFMYEPILDMSDEHLKSLYSAVKDLK
jgi:hypothetical protein